MWPGGGEGEMTLVGARVGRAAQKGDVHVHCYCFLLGQRVMKGVRRMLEGGGAQEGGSGPGRTPHNVKVGATANPSPTAMGIIKAETRGEAAGRRGVVQSHPPKMEKTQTEPKVEGERDGKPRGGSGSPQTSDPRLVV